VKRGCVIFPRILLLVFSRTSAKVEQTTIFECISQSINKMYSLAIAFQLFKTTGIVPVDQ
jgi:hypothetical protein